MLSRGLTTVLWKALLPVFLLELFTVFFWYEKPNRFTSSQIFSAIRMPCIPEFRFMGHRMVLPNLLRSFLLEAEVVPHDPRLARGLLLDLNPLLRDPLNALVVQNSKRRLPSLVLQVVQGVEPEDGVVLVDHASLVLLEQARAVAD